MLKVSALRLGRVGSRARKRGVVNGEGWCGVDFRERLILVIEGGKRGFMCFV
jgi:hypothetical protein